MLTRIISALVGIPIVVLLVFWPGGVPFTALIGIASIIGLFEFFRASRVGGARPHQTVGAIAALLFVWFGRDPNAQSFSFLAPIFTFLLLLTLTFELMRDPRSPYINIGVTAVGLGYVVWLLLHFAWIRGLSPTVLGPGNREMGAWLVMFVLLTTWAMDTGAYFVGKFYGKKKLVPNISPGKTVEGSVGGLISAFIVGTVLAAILHIPQPHGLILGVLIGIVGQIGDLAGSAFKREVGIKDFGSLMPGHGGILDRIDSLLFTGPVAYWYLVAFLSGWIGK